MGQKALSIAAINARIPARSLLKAVEYLEGRYISPSGHKLRMVTCKCSCGGQCQAVVAELLRGNPGSCGCVRPGPKLGSKNKVKKVKKLNKVRKRKISKKKPTEAVNNFLKNRRAAKQI